MTERTRRGAAGEENEEVKQENRKEADWLENTGSRADEDDDEGQVRREEWRENRKPAHT